MDAELRCPNKMHGIIKDGDVIEVRCTSRYCGAGDGWVVLHKFSTEGEFLDTVVYKSPRRKGA